MKNKFDRFLWTLLWLVIVTLAACFWFNALFAFNIFVAGHWQKLAQMQASQEAINPMFYISMVGVVIIAIAGLYVLMRPGFRRIRLPRMDKSPAPDVRDNNIPAQQSTPMTAPASQPAQTPAPTNANMQSVTAPRPTPITTTAPALNRPPRLTVPSATQNSYPAATSSVTKQNTPTTRVAPVASAPIPSPVDIADIQTIFEDAGYVPKGTPRIKGMPTALVAIGTNETLWIGAIGVTTDAMNTAVQTLRNIFNDTLEDIEINIYPFIVSPADAPADTDIKLFESTNELREYMDANTNQTPDPDDMSGFEAYSAYISTVVDYIGKI